MTDLNNGLTPEQTAIVQIATDAFIYGLPLVLVDLTQQQMTNCVMPGLKGAPINQFVNKSVFTNASNTGVVRPNCDTFYSSAFLNVSEPIVMCIPETDSQYYMMPLLDAFTNVIPGSPGTRTGQTRKGNYLLVGPHAKVPNHTNYEEFTIINCPTDTVWAIGRFQVDNPNAGDNRVNGGGYVKNLQAQLSIIPLSEWKNRDTYKPLLGKEKENVPTTTPNDTLKAMSITDFFTQLNQLLLTNPPTDLDTPAMQLFAKIGVGVNPATPFSERHFELAVLDAMNEIPSSIVTNMLGTKESSSTNSGAWNVTLDSKMGHYCRHYYVRAVIAINGLGANLVDDAVYFSVACDANAIALDGSNGAGYTLTFPITSNYPSVPAVPEQAFWSLTMYDPNGFLVPNDIDRYALGHSSEHPLQTSTDGDGNPVIVIYIQAEAIDRKDSRYNNWLPAPEGTFNLMLRVYWPGNSILNGTWTPPTVQKVSSQS